MSLKFPHVTLHSQNLYILEVRVTRGGPVVFDEFRKTGTRLGIPSAIEIFGSGSPVPRHTLYEPERMGAGLSHHGTNPLLKIETQHSC